MSSQLEETFVFMNIILSEFEHKILIYLLIIYYIDIVL